MKLNRKLTVNQLEAREVPAAYVFTGAIDSFWSKNGNWTANGVTATAQPGTSDNVTIGTGKTCYFDKASSVTIQSLTVNGNTNLDLGYATAGSGAKLIVDGSGTSTIGDNSGSTAGINNTTTTSGVFNSGGLIFRGTQTVNVNKATFSFYNIVDNKTNLLEFANSTVNFKSAIVADAAVWLGEPVSPTTWTTANFNMGVGSTFDLSLAGDIHNWSKSQSILQSGNIDQKNSNSFENTGIVEDTSSSDFKIKKLHNDVGGRLYLTGTAKLVSTVTSENTSVNYIWSQSGIDSNGGTSTFKSGSDTEFLSTSSFGGNIIMKGNFTFASGSTQGYHAHTINKPSATDPQSWTYGSFNSGGTVGQVGLATDSSGTASWYSRGNVNMEIWYDPITHYGYCTSFGSSVSGSVDVGGSMTLNTTGTIPMGGSQILIQSTGTQSVSTSLTQTGSTWLNTFSSSGYSSAWGVKNV
jgi:hypothetical protein